MSVADFEYTSTGVPSSSLFVAADEPLLVFPSVKAAESSLEAIDVVSGVYPAAYGPNGEPYRIGCEGNRVIIEVTGESNRPEELKALLLRYLEASARPVDSAKSVEDLVADVWRIESDFWQKHDPYGERFGSRIPFWGCVAFAVVLSVILYFLLR